MTGIQWMEKKPKKRVTINPMAIREVSGDIFEDMESTEPASTITHEQTIGGFEILHRGLLAGAIDNPNGGDGAGRATQTRPKLFAVVQFLSIEWHEAILKEQEVAAAAMLADPVGGSQRWARMKWGDMNIKEGEGPAKYLTQTDYLVKSDRWDDFRRWLERIGDIYGKRAPEHRSCLLYTSDAADE